MLSAKTEMLSAKVKSFFVNPNADEHTKKQEAFIVELYLDDYNADGWLLTTCGRNHNTGNDTKWVVQFYSKDLSKRVNLSLIHILSYTLVHSIKNCWIEICISHISSICHISAGPVSYTHLDVYKRQAGAVGAVGAAGAAEAAGAVGAVGAAGAAEAAEAEISLLTKLEIKPSVFSERCTLTSTEILILSII